MKRGEEGERRDRTGSRKRDRDTLFGEKRTHYKISHQIIKD